MTCFSRSRLLPPDRCAPPTGDGLVGALLGTGLGVAGGSIRGGTTAGRAVAGGCVGRGGAMGAGWTGVAITAVGIMSGVAAGTPDSMAFPHALQNLVPAFAWAPQLTQITMAAATGGEDGTLPMGAEH